MKNFEDKLKELENIHTLIKSGELSLDDSISQFEKGIKLAGELEKHLNKIEKKVEILINPENESPEEDPNFELFQ